MGDAGPDGVLLPCDQLHAPQQWSLPEHQRSFPGSAVQRHRRRITGKVFNCTVKITSRLCILNGSVVMFCLPVYFLCNNS